MKLQAILIVVLKVTGGFSYLYTQGTIDLGHPPWVDNVYGHFGDWRFNSFRDVNNNAIGAGYWYSRRNFIETVNWGFRSYLHMQDLLLKPKAQLTSQEKQFVRDNNYAKLIPIKTAEKWNLQFDSHTKNALLSEQMGLLHIPFDMQPGTLGELQSLKRDGVVRERVPNAAENAMGFNRARTNAWVGFSDSAHRVFVLISTPTMSTNPDTHHQNPDCRIHSVHSIVTHPTRSIKRPTDPTYVPDPPLAPHQLPPQPSDRRHLNVYTFSAKKKNGIQLIGSVVKPPHSTEPHPPRRPEMPRPDPNEPRRPEPNEPHRHPLPPHAPPHHQRLENVQAAAPRLRPDHQTLRRAGANILARMAGYESFEHYLNSFLDELE